MLNPGNNLAVLVVLGLLLLAASLALASYAYRVKRPRPLPARAPRIDWFPKYWIEVPIYSQQQDPEAIGLELRDWLGPLGFDLKRQSAEALWFGRGSSIGDLTTIDGRIVVIVPMPPAQPARVAIEYETGAILDTGNLYAFAHQLIDKQESAPRDQAAAPLDSGNPYQAPMS